MNIPFRTGVNMREFAYYGTPSIQYTSPALQAAQLGELRSMGVQLIRLFGACRRFTNDQNAQRLRTTLDLIHQYGMQAIIALNDSFNSEWIVPNEGAYHSGTAGHLHKNYWLQRVYRVRYIPYIQRVATVVAGHPALLMWELGNEFAIHPQPAAPTDERAFYNFVVEASAALKQITPVTLISTGLVNTTHVTVPATRAAAARRLYGLNTVDAVTIHYYADDGAEPFGALDVQIARELQKPFYVGEMGADILKMGDRGAFYAGEITQWRQAGAFTILPWAFDSSRTDVGVSDTRAFARIYGDYGGIKAAVQANATNAPAYRPLPAGAKRFRVALGPLSVRASASITSARLDLLVAGTEIDVDAASRTQAGGYIWWRHYGKQAWSAEKRLTDNTVYMIEVVS